MRKVIERGRFLSGEFAGQGWTICARRAGALYELRINDEFFVSGDMIPWLHDVLYELGDWYFKYQIE